MRTEYISYLNESAVSLAEGAYSYLNTTYKLGYLWDVDAGSWGRSSSLAHTPSNELEPYRRRS